MRSYVRILFKPAGAKRARWYWAIKLGPAAYKRCRPDGDTELASTIRDDGVEVTTEELLLGEAIKEEPAAMNLHYGWLEVRS